MITEMFYGAKPQQFERARALRENMTEAEKILWSRLKDNQLGVRFKPQHPIGIFIADFYSHPLQLVIELDGEIHNDQKEYDVSRTDELEKFGITVIRFPNNEVMNDCQQVLQKIRDKIIEIANQNSPQSKRDC